MKHLRVKQTAQETTTALDINKVSNYVESNELDASSTIEGSLNTDYVFQESQAVLSRFPNLTITPQDGVFIRDYLMRSSNEPLVKAFAESGIDGTFRKSSLPEGYVQTEYIEAPYNKQSGSLGEGEASYINLGFKCTDADYVSIDVYADSSSGSRLIYGTTRWNYNFAVKVGNNVGVIYTKQSGGTAFNFDINHRDKIVMQYDSTTQECTISTSKGTYSTSIYMVENNFPNYLFVARNSNNGSVGGISLGGTKNGTISCRVYHFFASKDGATIRDMYPCYRMSDGAAGMYDVANDVFYQNSGNIPFNVGQTWGMPQYTSHDIIHAIGDFVSKNNLDLTTFKSLTYNVLEAMVRIGKIDVEGCANLADVFDVSGLNALAEVNLKGTAVTQFKAENCPNLEKVALEAPTSLVIKNCPKMDLNF